MSLIPPRQQSNPPRAAEFEFENPFQKSPPEWEIQPMPATNHHENLMFALAWVQTASDPTIDFKLPSPHWDLVECRICDEENNSFPLSRTVHLSESVQTGFDYSLESNKTWRVDATFVGAREFHRPDPADFTDDEKRILEISFTGPEVRLTNSIGEIYIWRFDGHELSTRREKGIDRPYWVVLSTTNELKKSITWSGGSAWSGPFRGVQSQIWWMDNPVTSSNLTLHVAAPKVVRTTFYIKPAEKRSTP